MKPKPEILINASEVTADSVGDTYEFILDDKLNVVECVKVLSVSQGAISHIKNISESLENMLFELNHVRVNPRIDNTYIIQCLTQALEDIGVSVSKTPEQNSVAVCFKPLGEISDNVRFYINNIKGQSQVILLSPATKPKLVSKS